MLTSTSCSKLCVVLFPSMRSRVEVGAHNTIVSNREMKSNLKRAVIPNFAMRNRRGSRSLQSEAGALEVEVVVVVMVPSSLDLCVLIH